MKREGHSVWEILEMNTVRIEGVGDGFTSTGTGFFYRIENEKFGVAHFIVTNKHVIEGTNSLILNLRAYDKKNNKVIYNHKVNIPSNASYIYPHPTANVDLCAINIGHLLRTNDYDGFEILFGYIDSKQTYHNALKVGVSKLDPIEDIYMTGYPNGLWDEVNNKPLTRKGITATDVNYDFNGKKEFVVDMACFGGSSGSPVYIYNSGNYTVNGIQAIGQRFMLIGILYAGPVLTLEGNIISQNIPIDQNIKTHTQSMMNLGYVIKASELDYIRDLFPD